MKRTTRLSILFLLLCFAWASASATPLAGQSSTDSASSKRSKKDKKEKSSDQKPANAGKLDLNTASKEELDGLPGIGDALAQKIIDGRPYKSKRDLVSKGVLPSSAYDKIKDQVTARGGSKSEAGKTASSAAPVPATPATNATPKAPERNNTQASSRDEGASSSTLAQEPQQKGMVWVNLDSRVYHREGDRWYGKTKHGKFMTEADAQKAGYRASKTGPKGQ